MANNSKISAKDAESGALVPSFDLRTKKIKSLNTIYDLNVGVVEKAANMTICGDATVKKAAYFEGGAVGSLILPDGSFAIEAGSGVNITQLANKKLKLDIVINENYEDLTTQVENNSIEISRMAKALNSNGNITLIQQQIDTLSLDVSNILSRIENLSPGVGTKIAMNVVPSGVIDGSNKVFSLNSVPTPASSLMFFVNGQLLSQGEDKDFVLSGSTVTLANAPIPDDVIFAMYSYQTEVISYSINEPITIEINGLESNITLQNEPQPSSSLMLFMNGQLLTQNEDYVLISKNITLGQHLDEIESSTFFATYSY